jgi:tannase/feruloyl esterase
MSARRRAPHLACLFVALVGFLYGVFDARPAGAASCESLMSLALPNASITSAQTVAAGAFTPPTPARGGAAPAPSPFASLPAFCRVQAVVKRANDTDVKIEIWMPAQGWNGDFQPAASAFGGGSIGYGGVSQILRTGAATGATNRGHDSGGSPRWKSSDISSAAYHLMVEHGKKIVTAFYDKGPIFTLMNECGGAGSRDALQLVQDWPGDLDLANAVSFTNWGTHHGIAHMWVWQATHKTPDSFIPKSKYQVIHQGALDACDAKDGVKDGVIEDPPHCKFDPGVLLCRNGDAAHCLTAAQVEAVRTIYATPVHARTKAYIYGPMPPGSELGWEEMIGESPYPFSIGFFRDQVFKDPKWDYNTHRVNFDTDVDIADAPENVPINATNPDISKFIDRGGKLLLMGGWNDHTLSPGNNVHYYESVVARLGAGKIRDSVRLFMVPGMDHCLGDTYGPDAQYPTIYAVNFDPIGLLKQWKATGKAPDQIVVTTKGKQERKRLVCAYPRISSYKGSGSTDDPGNFVCKMP